MKTKTKEENAAMTALKVSCEEVRAADLQLGDRVLLFAHSYGFATVVAVADEYVEVFRPYVHTSEIQYSNGSEGGGRLISYIGSETVKLPIDSDRPVFRNQKGRPPQ